MPRRSKGLRGDVAEMQQMIEGYLAFARGEGQRAAGRGRT